MILELLRKADGYLVGRVSLRDLETTLVSSLQSILDSRDAAAIELANKIDVGLMRLGDGFISQGEFGRVLEEALASFFTVSVGPSPSRRDVCLGASDTTVWTCFEDPTPLVRDFHFQAVLG